MKRNQKRDLIHENQRVFLDGTSWWACSFHNCEIIVNTGDFDLQHCSFNNCKLTFGGNAIAILSIIELFYPNCLPYITGNRPNPSSKE